MADEIDRAQAAQIRDTEIAIKEMQRFKNLTPSNGICTECGCTIPAKRVELINATTCITCAKEIERESRFWR